MLSNAIRRRDLAWMVVVILLLATVWVARSNEAEAGGPSADGIDLVYVAVSDNFPDSLGVGPGAGANAAPIIILPTDPPIPSASRDELIRLDPKSVIIVGGTAVISPEMEADLKSLLPNATVERIAGDDRFETNAMFSEQAFPVERWASVPAAAFSPENPATDNAQIGAAFSHNVDGALVAPIQLPHGAEILEFRINALDTLAGGTIHAELRRALSAGDLLIASVDADDEVGGIYSTTDIAEAHSTVDNAFSGYVVHVIGADDPQETIGTVSVRYRLGAPGS